MLLPVFVLGRAQELLLLLDEYWSQHPELHSIPIYYASSLARKCISIYQTYIHTMNEHIRSRFNRRDNPFVFKHVSNLRSLEKFEDKGPCVMMASPGFMQSGVSRQLLERWAPDRRNGLIVTGYSVEGTMARNVIKEPDEILSMAGQKIPLRMSVDYISFSAHVDFTQNSRFIDEVKAQHIVLVHGEQSAMNRLKVALQNRFANRNEDVKVHTPRNCEVLKIKFKGERMAKAIGSIAEKPPKPDSMLDGLLISKDFAYTILDPKDLADFTGLNMSTIIQRQRISLHVAWSLARWHLEGMYGHITEGVDLEGRRTMRIMDVLDIKQSATSRYELILEWASSVANDMIADSAVALLLGIDSSPASVKMTSQGHSHDHDHAQANGHADPVGEDDKRLADDHPHYTQSTKSSLTRTEQLVAFLEAHFGEVEQVMIGKDDTLEDAEMRDIKEEEEEQDEVKQEPEEVGITVKKEEEEGNDDDEAMHSAKEEHETNGVVPLKEHAPTPSLESTISGSPRLALKVTLDRDSAILETDSLSVYSRSATLQAKVEQLAKLAVQAQASIADSFLLEPAITAELFQGGHVPPVEPASASKSPILVS